jgi:hypothetical protein
MRTLALIYESKVDVIESRVQIDIHQYNPAKKEYLRQFRFITISIPEKVQPKKYLLLVLQDKNYDNVGQNLIPG